MKTSVATALALLFLAPVRAGADSGPLMTVYDVVVDGRVVGPVGLLTEEPIVAVDADTGASLALAHSTIHSLNRTADGYEVFFTYESDPRLTPLKLSELHVPAPAWDGWREAAFYARPRVCAALRRARVELRNPRSLYEGFPEVVEGSRAYAEFERSDLFWVHNSLTPCTGFAQDRIATGPHHPICKTAYDYWTCHRGGSRTRAACEAIERSSYWPCGRMALLRDANLETARDVCARGFRFACERAKHLDWEQREGTSWLGPTP